MQAIAWPVLAAFVWALTGPRATADDVVAGLEPARRWNVERATHLLERAGFGGSFDDARRLASMPIKEAVASVVRGPSRPGPESRFRASLLHADGARRGLARSSLPESQQRALRMQLRSVSRAELHTLQAWWIKRMVETDYPFREKMTLFWHGHFTSGAREVRSVRWLAAQNQLFRQKGTGSFGSLLAAVCHDPAMLRYLDNVSNRKRHPNENFARELLELFTLGPGNFTEDDVRDTARAFTGWGVDDRGFRFRKRLHDRGMKTILGNRGRWDGDDVVRMLLEQPATAVMLAERLLSFFLVDEPPAALVGAFAQTLRDSDDDVGGSLRVLFESEAFYSRQWMGDKIKSPAEWVVGLLREVRPAQVDYRLMADLMGEMGQTLFQPPNVKGWPHGRSWVSADSLFRRQRLVDVLTYGVPDAAWERRERSWVEARDACRALTDAAEPAPRSGARQRAPNQAGDEWGLWAAISQVDHIRQQAVAIPGDSDRRERRSEEIVDDMARRLGGHPVSADVRRTVLRDALDDPTGAGPGRPGANSDLSGNGDGHRSGGGESGGDVGRGERDPRRRIMHALLSRPERQLH